MRSDKFCFMVKNTNLNNKNKPQQKEVARTSDYTHSLVEAIIDPFVIIDFNGKITDANSQMENITGKTQKELVDSDFSICFTEPSKAKEAYEQVFKKGAVINCLLYIKHKKGKITSVSYNASIYKDKSGKIMGVFAVARDITEQKKDEVALKESEKKFKTIIENAPIGIYYNDFKGTFLYGNKKAEELIGYKREELIGKNFLKLGLLQIKDIVRATRLLSQNILGKSTCPNEFTLVRKNRTTKIVLINTEIITIDRQKVVLGMVLDITERKQAEEELKKQNSDLEKSNKLMLGRELKMVELKKKIKELEKS